VAKIWGETFSDHGENIEMILGGTGVIYGMFVIFPKSAFNKFIVNYSLKIWYL